MIEIVASVVAAAVVGSVHCTSMCGGLVAFSTAGPGATGRARLGALSAYNLARGLGYAGLGATAGAVGSSLDAAGLRSGVGRVAGAVAGVVMIAWGIARLLQACGLRRATRSTENGVHVPVARLVRRIKDESPAVRAAVVGGCTALLPCGFLHAFLVVAAGTGSATRGALVMASFWLGTLPAVVGLGASVDLLTRPLRRHAAILGAVVMVGFGMSSLLGRWSPPFVGASLVAPHGSGACHAH